MAIETIRTGNYSASSAGVLGKCRKCGLTVYKELEHRCPRGVRFLRADKAKTLRKRAVELAKAGQYRQAKQLFAEVGDLIAISRILAREGRWQDATEAANEALLTYPVEAHLQLADIAEIAGDGAKCDEHTEAAFSLEPDNKQLRGARALRRLAKGDYQGGWEDLKYRGWYRHPAKEAPQPEWNGSDLTGKTIVVLQEQGMGDQLMYVRCIPWLRVKNPKLICIHPNESQERLLQAAFPDCRIILADTKDKPKTDEWVSMMSLPILGAPFLWEAPYLHPLPGAVEEFSKHVPKTGRKRVGVCWSGSPGHVQDKNRSLPFSAFQPILNIEGVDFYALQFGPESQYNDRIPDLSLFCSDYADTAAVLHNLDLLITVDTSLANLAGALGVPAWVMLRTPIDYRWGSPDERSDWYGSIRQFRNAPLEDVAAALRETITGEMRAIPTPEIVKPNPITDVETRYGKMSVFTYDLWCSRSLRMLGEWSEGEMDVMRAMLPKDGSGVVIEAGAHVGAHTLGLGKICTHVAAFEPQYYAYVRLVQNIEDNGGNVWAHNAALGEKSGEGFMVSADPCFPGNPGGCELLLKESPDEVIPGARAVRITTVDEVTGDDHVDLIKADVEGCEMAVVLGAINTIRRCRPVLYLEENDQSPELRRMLMDWGYHVVLHKIPIWNPDNFKGAKVNPFGSYVSVMLLCVPEERTDLLKSKYCGGSE